MKLRRGCGCPLIILAVVNLFFVVGSIIQLVSGPSDEPVRGSTTTYALGLVLFLANLVVAAITALAAFRGQPMTPSAEEDMGLEGVESDAVQDDDEAPSDDI